MRLHEIRVSNFKGLRSAVFSPTSFGCLVGENNAGKSSVLQSIVYALNRPATIAPDLFYDKSLPIEFSILFTSVTEPHLKRLSADHRIRIEDLVTDQQFRLFVRYRSGQRVEVTTQRSVPKEARYRQDAISAALAGKRGAAVKAVVISEYPEFADGLADGANATNAKEHLNAKIAALPADAFEISECPLPSGIPASISDLLPEPIYIPAVKNLGDEMKTTQSTHFGRLLGLLLEDMTPDLDAIRQSLQSLDSMLNRVVVGDDTSDTRHEKVKTLEANIESFLSENFPQVKLELRVPPPELKTILNAAQIFVNDGSHDLIDNKGDGIKRSLTFALLQTYVSHLTQKSTSSDPDAPALRPLIFLFEEPELYLHPKSQRVLFNTLSKISERHQVVVTTHSPLFFEPGVTASFVRIAKVNAVPKPIGELYPVDFSLDSNSAEVFRLTKFENADAAFFSRRVVLFEGESDDCFFKHISKTINPTWDFDQKNIALVRVSGKGNFAKYRSFFERFGIDVKIVADLDALFDGYSHLNGNAEADAARTKAIVIIDSHIEAHGIKIGPAARQIKDKVNGNSWRARYEAAKFALQEIQRTKVVTDDTIQLLDGLFDWEKEVARVSACNSHMATRAALTPTLDALRKQGICVLGCGAIEDYYPENTPQKGPKPDRALAATSLVDCQETAFALSKPLGTGRRPELVEILEELFRAI